MADLAILRKLTEIEMNLRMMQKDSMNVKECAYYMGVTQSHLRHLTSDRKIPFYKKLGRLFFSKKEIDEWRLSDRIPTNEEMLEIARNLY